MNRIISTITLSVFYLILFVACAGVMQYYTSPEYLLFTFGLFIAAYAGYYFTERYWPKEKTYLSEYSEFIKWAFNFHLFFGVWFLIVLFQQSNNHPASLLIFQSEAQAAAIKSAENIQKILKWVSGIILIVPFFIRKAIIWSRED